MFKKRKKEESTIDRTKNNELIDGVRHRIDKAEDTIREAATKAGIEDLDAIYEMNRTLNSLILWYGWLDSNTAELETKCSERIELVEEYEAKCLKKIEDMLTAISTNKEAIDKMIEDGMPLFLVIETNNIDRSEPDIDYVFCYEFKKTETNGLYNAYVLSSDNRESYLMKVFAGESTVRAMTEEEFENKYIINRLSVMEFEKEEEIVEYDNKVRNLFHGQRIIY